MYNRDALIYFSRDNVEWDAAQEELARQKVAENSSVFAHASDQEKYEVKANVYWDEFYGIHQNRFFKDRHWLFTEFPELAPYTKPAENEVEIQSGLTPGSVNEESISGSGDKVEQLSQEIETVSITNDERTCNGRKIFEIGCGVGNTVFPILQYSTEPGLFVYCCDFSSKAVEILKENPEYDQDRYTCFSNIA